MIRKINLSGVECNKPSFKQSVKCEPNKPCSLRNDSEVTSKEGAEAVKTLAFCGGSKIDVSGNELGIILNDFIDSDDVITLSDDKTKKNYTLKKTDSGFEVTQGENTVFRAEFENIEDLPKVTYKMGKFKPEITIHDESLSDGRIQMFKGSQIKAEKFTLTMPGETKNHGVSFTGRTLVTTLNKENRTKDAVDKYFKSGLAQKTTKGDYAEFMKEQDPTIAIPAGGFGTRFENMTVEDDENKPSFRLPTDDNYRIMATSLNMGAMAGLTGGEGDTLVYASQSKDDDALQEGENVRKVDKYKTDGGAVFEALEKEYIPQDKDLIILNADIITNADITRTYKALKSLPDAALVIPYYPVDSQRAKSFGLMGLEKDENGNMQIKDFIEKPPHTDVEPLPNKFDSSDKYKSFDEVHEAWEAANQRAKLEDGRYYGNPGIYVMSKEAANVLRELGVEDSGKTGLGADVMPEIVKRCKEGTLLNEKGEPMKVYTVPLERKGGTPAFWDDIGSAEAYMDTIKNIAVETSEKGAGPENSYYGIPEFVLNDFNKNFDQETGVLYMSDKAKDEAAVFAEKYGAEIKGNVFIAD